MLWPLMLIVAIVVRVHFGRPVIFRQVRPGLRGRLFTIYKFRTMHIALDRAGASSDADRLTPLGRLLRSTSFDELPELWNVLKGEMSLVGPRPLLPEYLPRYTETQARRHEVRPGITGWAQVSGRNSLDWRAKFDFDVWYAENASFVLDVRILFMTLWQTTKRSGISQPGQATVEEFMGSNEG